MRVCELMQFDLVGDHTRPVTWKEMENYTSKETKKFMRSIGGKEYTRMIKVNGINRQAHYSHDPSGTLRHKVYYQAIKSIA